MSLVDTLIRPTRGPASISLRTRLELWRSRQALSRLDHAALRDIGVTPREAEAEADLAFWDVPENWKCR